jgi:hypothetical protein
MTKKELWLRIKGYHFEHIVPTNMWDKITEMFGAVDASTKAFANKISRKYECSTSYAVKAINEYKKFLYLAVISDFHVTPSQAIDKVWHEHILFTQGYSIFCKEIIEYNLNHHPELISLQSETERFHAQYLSTIKLYIEEFGKFPPTNIWNITKYDQEKVVEDLLKARQKKVSEELYFSNNSYATDLALYTSFDNADTNFADSYPEFGGFDGGESGGAGASGAWSDSSNDGDSDASDGSSGDGGGGDGGDGGGCSGGCGGGD